MTQINTLRGIVAKDKQKNLEKLKYKIYSELSERVTKLSGGDESADPKRENGSDTVHSNIREQQISELRLTLKRQEARIQEHKKENVKSASLHNAGFIIFDNTPLRARQIQNMLGRIGCLNTYTVSDMTALLNSYLDLKEITKLEFTAIIVPVENYSRFNSHFHSEVLTNSDEKLTGIDKTPVFVAVSKDATQAASTGLDPKMIISLGQDPEYNQKKISLILENLMREKENRNKNN